MPAYGNRNGAGEIPVAPIAAEATRKVEAGETWSAIARRAGFMRPDLRKPPRTQPDVSRLKRRLGLRPTPGKRGRGSFTSTGMRYETAQTLVAALNLDPVDFDI